MNELNHTNGKGSKTRVTNVKAFRANYAEINWHREVTCQCQRCLQPVSSLEQHFHRPGLRRRSGGIFRRVRKHQLRNYMIPDFKPWPKIPRLSRDCIVSEKLDGTSSAVVITEDGQLFAQSRTRFITPENDNYGFAKWVNIHRDELLKLGPGCHHGEYWGPGIQRSYPALQKTFSLFNTSRWIESEATRIDEKQEIVPLCCKVVPVLYRGPFDTRKIEETLVVLQYNGSVACPGYTRPEGIIIYHTVGGHYYKKLIENDDSPKGN